MSDSERRQFQFERQYEASVEDLWELWTTKEGFESWWGPAGFRVEVRQMEARVGGGLLYDMIAVGEAERRYMQEAGMPLSHETRGTFVEVEPFRSLSICHRIDFIDGVEPYDNTMRVEFSVEGSSVRMTITVDAHREAHWTNQARKGMESQLTKLPTALATRRNRPR